MTIRVGALRPALVARTRENFWIGSGAGGGTALPPYRLAWSPPVTPAGGTVAARSWRNATFHGLVCCCPATREASHETSHMATRALHKRLRALVRPCMHSRMHSR